MGVLVLPLRVSRYLKFLEKRFLALDEPKSAFLAVFLSSGEYEVFKGQGNDALMNYFTINEKDLVAW